MTDTRKYTPTKDTFEPDEKPLDESQKQLDEQKQSDPVFKKFMEDL